MWDSPLAALFDKDLGHTDLNLTLKLHSVCEQLVLFFEPVKPCSFFGRRQAKTANVITF